MLSTAVFRVWWRRLSYILVWSTGLYPPSDGNDLQLCRSESHTLSDCKSLRAASYTTEVICQLSASSGRSPWTLASSCWRFAALLLTQVSHHCTTLPPVGQASQLLASPTVAVHGDIHSVVGKMDSFAGSVSWVNHTLDTFHTTSHTHRLCIHYYLGYCTHSLAPVNP